jgi:hypothetical protein
LLVSGAVNVCSDVLDELWSHGCFTTVQGPVGSVKLPLADESGEHPEARKERGSPRIPLALSWNREGVHCPDGLVIFDDTIDA